jgi:hypothetical protein
VIAVYAVLSATFRTDDDASNDFVIRRQISPSLTSPNFVDASTILARETTKGDVVSGKSFGIFSFGERLLELKPVLSTKVELEFAIDLPDFVRHGDLTVTNAKKVPSCLT